MKSLYQISALFVRSNQSTELYSPVDYLYFKIYRSDLVSTHVKYQLINGKGRSADIAKPFSPRSPLDRAIAAPTDPSNTVQPVIDITIKPIRECVTRSTLSPIY